ncbi:MAG: carboxypeptidase M32 [Lachnospiraceae bacterium]|nr:carboxypeptidase M32 [Lachnospiraceae bacterium]
MDEKIRTLLERVKDEDGYLRAERLMEFDLQTVCPENEMSREGELIAEVEKQAFMVRNGEGFVRDVLDLYKSRDSYDEEARALIERRYRIYLSEKNMTDETSHRHSLIEQQAYADWSVAKENKEFSRFSDSLKKVIGINRERIELREKGDDENFECGYDILLDRFERGVTVKDLDILFGEMKDRLTVLLEKIKNSNKRIRTDFLSIRVTNEQQQKAADFIKELMGLDPKRSSLQVCTHAFSERIDRDDVRLTTYYMPYFFLSNVYSILHEGGHSLFELLSPYEDSDFYIYDNKTLGMHESVSRFYENVIGRSREFIDFVYPEFKKIFPQVFKDVSCDELFEAVNYVAPSLIRTEADEVTYPLHILIRYELEKAIFEGDLKVSDLPENWNRKYGEYLGIVPSNDAEGVLQDVHWSSDFGYFPTYSIGNFYNAMYFGRMKKEIDVGSLVRSGDLKSINKWMQDNVFRKACRLTPKEWIKDITGRELTCSDYMTYLEEKYSRVYEL